MNFENKNIENEEKRIKIHVWTKEHSKKFLKALKIYGYDCNHIEEIE